MLFNSLEFLVFFLIIVILYYGIPHRFRWLFLLIASCYFYMAFVPVYILILFATIIVDYVAGIMIEKSEGKERKYWLYLSIVITVLILAIFKYYNFIVENLNQLGFYTGIPISMKELGILLPIGLSFHTFQSLSYVMEIYYGRQKAERHFGIYSLFVMFFPQLVAGPIERPQNLLGQFREKHFLNWDMIGSGLRLMLIGYFKKLVIADRLAGVADPVFNDPLGQGSVAVIIAAICFSIQIYCDFSGYTDIARGTARVLGFELMRNFNLPYLAANISDFWRRWHISLSTWFKDYLYFPLGGSRRGVITTCRNLLIVFIVSGIWHGASWNFVIWGALHGLWMVINFIFNYRYDNRETIAVSYFVKVMFTFSIVTFAWIFFRAPDIATSWIFIQEMAHYSGLSFLFTGDIKYHLFVGVGSFILITFLEYYAVRPFLLRLPILGSRPAQWMLCYAIIMVLLLFGKFYTDSQFIYFQF